jgi:hypothetical protein
MVIQYGTNYRDIDETQIGLNTYIIYFTHAIVNRHIINTTIDTFVQYLDQSDVSFEQYRRYVQILGVNSDMAGIIIRHAVQSFLKVTGKRMPNVPYLVYYKGQEFLSESAWETAHWHIAYAIYKHRQHVPVARQSRCIIL